MQTNRLDPNVYTSTQKRRNTHRGYVCWWSLKINIRYSIHEFAPGYLPNFLVYPSIKTTISLESVSNFLWLVWPAFLSSRCQAFSPLILPAKTQTHVPPQPHKRRLPGTSWAVGNFHYYTTQARHSTGSFNPVCMLQTNGMVQPTLPVRKRWKQTQYSSLNVFS
jgi:hypothetical protein